MATGIQNYATTILLQMAGPLTHITPNPDHTDLVLIPTVDYNQWNGEMEGATITLQISNPLLPKFTIKDQWQINEFYAQAVDWALTQNN